MSKLTNVQFTLNNMTLAGLTCGASDHKDNVVLCLHGWLDNAASFKPIMPYFQNTMPEKHVVAIDWFGHGHSSHRSVDAHYHFVDWIYDLLALFEKQKWQQVDIIGHSMGGMIASAFSAAFPEKVKSLTLIDSIGFISNKSEQTTQQLREGMLSRLKSETKRVSSKPKKYHASLDSAIKARMSVSDLQYPQAKLLVERGLMEVPQGFNWRSDNRLKNTSPYRLTFKQAQQFIKDIQCPVKLIYGSHGLDMVSIGIKNFAALFRSFTSVKIEGGHHVHMEQPEKTAKLIQYFLAE